VGWIICFFYHTDNSQQKLTIKRNCRLCCKIIVQRIVRLSLLNLLDERFFWCGNVIKFYFVTKR
jgi:hypothetical protein